MHYELNKCRGALFCLSLVLVAAGCSMSDDLDCPPEGGLANSGKTYIRLSFAMPGSGGTRATGGELGDDQEAGQSNENTISSAVAFLYKADDGVKTTDNPEIAAVVEFNNLTGPDDGIGKNENGHEIDKVYTKTQEVPGIVEYGKYNVIVAANLKENLPSGESEWWNSPQLKLDEVRDHILTKAWNETPSGEKMTYSNFLMTNESDASITLAEENTSANPAEITVDVERVAARVDYMAENEYTCTDPTYEGGTVKILGATIVNDYTAGSFLLKRVADNVSGTTNMSYLGDETPTPSGVATNYVIDPLTSQKNEANKNGNFTISQNGKNFQTRANMYASGTHSSAWSGDPNWWKGKVTAGTPMTGEGDGWTRIGYTLENTTPSGTDFAGAKEYNTGVVFQAQFTPVATAVSSKYYDYEEGRTFFEYQGKLYSTMEDLANAFFPSNNFENFKDELNAEEYATWKSVNALIESIEVNNDPSGYKDFLVKEADGKEFLEDLPKDIDKKLEVTGYTIGGEDESRGVTLIGKRFLKSNKVLNLNSPFTKFDDENEPYQFAFELEQSIQACEYEVNEYLFNKKWKVVQQELPFEEETPVSDIAPDNVPEAVTEMPEDADVKDFQAVMDNSTVTIEIGGNKVKPRRQRAKQMAS